MIAMMLTLLGTLAPGQEPPPKDCHLLVPYLKEEKAKAEADAKRVGALLTDSLRREDERQRDLEAARLVSTDLMRQAADLRNERDHWRIIAEDLLSATANPKLCQRVCDQLGTCVLTATGSCVAVFDKDCARAFVCKADGKCFARNGLCREADGQP